MADPDPSPQVPGALLVGDDYIAEVRNKDTHLQSH